MTHEEKGSEGSENPNQITRKHDRADGEDMAPFKKRVRFLWSDDLKEVINNKTECSGANRYDMKVSSTSGRIDAGEENKMEINLTPKNLTSTTCNEDDFSSSLSQLAISESGGTGNEPRGDGGGKHEKESNELIQHTADVVGDEEYIDQKTAGGTKHDDGGKGESDPEEQGKHGATEDDGEMPLDYVVSHGGHGCSDNALGSSRYADTRAGSSEGDHHEQGQRQTAIEGTNIPDADGGNDPPTFLVSSEGGHSDHIQQAANSFQDPDGDMQTQQEPMTTMDLRKRTRSIHEQGEVSHDVGGGGQEARKKCKHVSDGGSNSAVILDEPPMQQANHSFLLFGVNIPCEQDPDVPINTNDGLESGNYHIAGDEFNYGAPPTQQPTDGIQLFGVYMGGEQVQPVAVRGIQLFGVYITEEQVHSVDIHNRDGRNSHGGGESSMQPPRSGLRLFGFDF